MEFPGISLEMEMLNSGNCDRLLIVFVFIIGDACDSILGEGKLLSLYMMNINYSIFSY